jgi:magnesium transporter
MKKNPPSPSILYADDDYESIATLMKLRAPSLILGLVLGIGISLTTSRFEETISKNIQVAFFLPFIVYIADAIGTQTESIYARDLRTGKAKFINYLKKEFVLGIIFAALFGLFAGFITWVWLKNELLSYSIGIATLAAVASAPIIALLITEGFQLLGRDPATSSGPIATVIQDMISVVIYGSICSMILLP